MFGDTPLVMIEDDASLRALVDDLRNRDVVGVDTEADSFHHYQEKLCLVQISDADRDYIVDPLKVDDVSPLGDLLEDPTVIKILHGGDYDVVSLKRDLGINIRNIFDTMIAAQFLGLPRFGLADLIKRYFGHTIDKRYQRHDWASRPLLPEHLDYARGDTHFLLALHEVLQHRLRQTRRLAAHSEECCILEERTWSRTRDPETAFLLMKKARGLKGDAELKALRAVWEYRDEIARRRDRPAFKVLPEDVLVAIAKGRPEDEAALHKIIRATSSMARRHGKGLLEAVQAAAQDERPIPPKPAASKSARRNKSGGASVDRFLGPLKEWRNAVVSKDRLAPVVVASNGLLKEVARVAPDTLQDLADVPGIRKWQVRHYGSDILDVIEAVRTPATKRRRRRRKSAAT